MRAFAPRSRLQASSTSRSTWPPSTSCPASLWWRTTSKGGPTCCRPVCCALPARGPCWRAARPAPPYPHPHPTHAVSLRPQLELWRYCPPAAPAPALASRPSTAPPPHHPHPHPHAFQVGHRHEPPPRHRALLRLRQRALDLQEGPRLWHARRARRRHGRAQGGWGRGAEISSLFENLSQKFKKSLAKIQKRASGRQRGRTPRTGTPSFRGVAVDSALRGQPPCQCGGQARGGENRAQPRPSWQLPWPAAAVLAASHTPQATRPGPDPLPSIPFMAQATLLGPHPLPCIPLALAMPRPSPAHSMPPSPAVRCARWRWRRWRARGAARAPP